MNTDDLILALYEIETLRKKISYNPTSINFFYHIFLPFNTFIIREIIFHLFRSNNLNFIIIKCFALTNEKCKNVQIKVEIFI